MERQNPVPQMPPICPLETLFLLCSGSPGWTEFSQGDAEDANMLPTSARIDLLPELMWYPYMAERERKGEKEREGESRRREEELGGCCMGNEKSLFCL